VIAFECVSDVNGSGEISTVSPGGTQVTDLLKDRLLVYVQTAGGPQWSPDGSRLLFLAHRIGHRGVHVWTIRPDGQNLTRIG
jgi:Tol biopolymer transport system component